MVLEMQGSTFHITYSRVLYRTVVPTLSDLDVHWRYNMSGSCTAGAGVIQINTPTVTRTPTYANNTSS